LALLLLMAVVGLVCVVFGSSPVPWSRLRRIERHWVRAYGGFPVLLAAAVTAAKALHALPVTYGLLAAAFVRSEALDQHVDGLGDGDRRALVVAVQIPADDRAVAPTGVAEALLQPAGAGVVHPHAEGDPPVAQLAGGGLAGPKQSAADAAPLQRAEHLQVVEPRHARQPMADLRLLGRPRSRNTSPTGQPSSQATSSAPPPARCLARQSPKKERSPLNTATSGSRSASDPRRILNSSDS
jgi:hypothetical protein